MDLIESFLTISTCSEEAEQQNTTTPIVSGKQTAKSLLLIVRKPTLPRDRVRKRDRLRMGGRRGSWKNSNRGWKRERYGEGGPRKKTQERHTGMKKREKWGSPFLSHFIRPLGELHA